MTTATQINWAAAEHIASRLGALTRQLVDDRDPDAVREWALRMATECSADGTSDVNWPRAASYLELATLVRGEQQGDNDDPGD
jgi:hypothetical protein